MMNVSRSHASTFPSFSLSELKTTIPSRMRFRSTMSVHPLPETVGSPLRRRLHPAAVRERLAVPAAIERERIERLLARWRPAPEDRREAARGELEQIVVAARDANRPARDLEDLVPPDDPLAGTEAAAHDLDAPGIE